MKRLFLVRKNITKTKFFYWPGWQDGGVARGRRQAGLHSLPRGAHNVDERHVEEDEHDDGHNARDGLLDEAVHAPPACDGERARLEGRTHAYLVQQEVGYVEDDGERDDAHARHVVARRLEQRVLVHGPADGDEALGGEQQVEERVQVDGQVGARQVQVGQVQVTHEHVVGAEWLRVGGHTVGYDYGAREDVGEGDEAQVLERHGAERLVAEDAQAHRVEPDAHQSHRTHDEQVAVGLDRQIVRVQRARRCCRVHVAARLQTTTTTTTTTWASAATVEQLGRGWRQCGAVGTARAQLKDVDHVTWIHGERMNFPVSVSLCLSLTLVDVALLAEERMTLFVGAFGIVDYWRWCFNFSGEWVNEWASKWIFVFVSLFLSLSLSLCFLSRVRVLCVWLSRRWRRRMKE